MSAVLDSTPVATIKMHGRWLSREHGRRLGALAGCALPGALTLYLSLNSGGYLAGSQGAAVAFLAVIVAVRVLFIREPFAGFTRLTLLTFTALAFYAAWSLLSGEWSHAPSRALLAFTLVCLYLLVTVLAASLNGSEWRARRTLIFTWASMVVVCVVALATRLCPDLFPISLSPSPNRLSYPLTYWNALGIFAVVALVLTMHLATTTRKRKGLRLCATAAVPIVAVTILLTYSRAAAFLAIVAIAGYAALARSPSLIRGLVPALVPAGVAIVGTYEATLVSNADTSAAGVGQGHVLVLVILACCVAAAGTRVAVDRLVPSVSRARRRSLSQRQRRIVLALCVAAVAVVAVAFSGRVASEFSNFVRQDSSVGTSDVRNRLNSIRIGGRLTVWNVALDMYERHPITGSGANAFPVYWEGRYPYSSIALQVHSIYLQALSELGIPGLLAILTFVCALAVAIAGRRRSGDRALWSAVAVAAILWALHAGVDWDWQMPAVTIPVLALGAAALGVRTPSRPISRRAWMPMRACTAVVALALVALGLEVRASDRNLQASLSDFVASRCARAVPEAARSISAVSSRPEPYLIQGICSMEHSAYPRAVIQLRAAVSNDPLEWRYHYALALAQAADGLNPANQLRQAGALTPLRPMFEDTQALLDRTRPALRPALAVRLATQASS